MKKVIKGIELNIEQYNTLSLLATYCHNRDTASKEKVKRYNNCIEALDHACCILDIDSSLIFDVRLKDYRKGLRNYNRLSYIDTFE